MLYFVFSVILLTAMLFFPTSKLIWVLSVRRLQRKRQAELSEPELRGQMTRARFVAVFLGLLFSFLFNLSILGIPGHG